MSYQTIRYANNFIGIPEHWYRDDIPAYQQVGAFTSSAGDNNAKHLKLNGKKWKYADIAKKLNINVQYITKQVEIYGKKKFERMMECKLSQQ